MAFLTLSELKKSVSRFTREISQINIHELFGVTDGKAVGSYVEVLFNTYLKDRYNFSKGNLLCLGCVSYTTNGAFLDFVIVLVQEIKFGSVIIHLSIRYGLFSSP